MPAGGIVETRHSLERGILPLSARSAPVVGRNNHYGSKSRHGTQIDATLYPLLETDKLHRLDPTLYLDELIRAKYCCPGTWPGGR